MFCDLNYATNKETRNIVSSVVDTLGWKLLTFNTKTQGSIKLSSMDANYVALPACAQEVKFVNMLLKGIYEFQKPSIMLEDNQGDILLVKNRQVYIHNKTSTYATFF